MDNKYFSIDDIQEVATEDSVEFAVARIAVLSTKKNMKTFLPRQQRKTNQKTAIIDREKVS